MTDHVTCPGAKASLDCFSPGGRPSSRPTPPARRRRRLLALVVSVTSLLVLRPDAPLAQEVTGPALKAAFLFNFVKFTTWPAEALPDGAPLAMCVVNAPGMGSALLDAVQGRVVAGHAIRVVDSPEATTLRSCHVLYVSGPRMAALTLVDGLGEVPVLTVSDLQGFTGAGGIAQLHVQQGQLRFAFSLEAARAAHLQISSRLLALARQP